MRRFSTVTLYAVVPAIWVSAFNATVIAQESESVPPDHEVSDVGAVRSERIQQMLGDAQQRMRENRFDDAALLLESLLAFEPENGVAWYRYGLALHSAGRYREALPAHIMAAEFDVVFPNAAGAGAYNAACVYAIENKKDKAFRWLEKSRTMGFRNLPLLRNDQDLNALRDDPRFDVFVESIRGRSNAAAPPVDEKIHGEEFEPQLGDPADLPAPRQFDFWVGEWDVFNTQRQKVGENVVQKMVGGHLIMENWTAANGTTGKSMNFYDPAEKKWTQYWVGAKGGVITMTGSYEDGAMRLVGTSTNQAGKVTTVRCTFTPQPDGMVRQVIENKNDDGEWKISFEGVYRRKPQRNR